MALCVVGGFVFALAMTFFHAGAEALPQGGPDEPSPIVKEIPLTAQQVEGFIAAQKPIAAVVDKLSDEQAQNPSPELIAQLDSIAKANKFANYAEFQAVSDNIGLVLSGIDPRTKKYIGAGAVIKQEIADVEADKTLSAQDKQEQLDDLNAQLKNVQLVVIQGNVDLVVKYYDQIIASLPKEDKQ
jgi:hypothetical protein